MHVFIAFRSASVTLNGNISDLLLKYGIIYQSVGFLSVSCIVSFHQISQYFRDFSFSGSNPVNTTLHEDDS